MSGQRTGPIPQSYWVVPGAFAAGEYPFDLDPVAGAEKIAAIHAAGIDAFLDLTEEDEYGLLPYEPQLGDLEYARFPIRDEDIPSVPEMRAVLNAIDDRLAHGRHVYLHCWGGHGRTGTVVGCWLVRHGSTAAEALRSIAEWRRALPDHGQPSPATREQRDFVANWQASA